MTAAAVAAVWATFWVLMLVRPVLASSLSTKAVAFWLLMRPAELAMRPVVKALR